MKKLALIGCGGIGRYHLGNFLQSKDIVELVGFCDIIPEKAESFVKEAGCGKAFENYIDMYNEVEPDMVFICIPPYAHGDIEFETIRRGIPFFVEKPVALDMDLARRIRDAAEAKNLITASGFQCRYSKLAERNIQFCRENEVVCVMCERTGGVPSAWWWRNKETSGGQVVEQAIHQYDMVRYTLGEPVEVSSFSTRGFVRDVENYNTDDCSVTIVRFENGSLGAFAVGDYAKNGNAADEKIIFKCRDKRAEHRILDSFRIYGEAPKEESDENKGFIIAGDGAVSAGGGCVEYKEDETYGLRCDRTFMEAVISGDPSKIRSPYRDALKSVVFTMAINESMATGKAVRIDLDR